MKETIGLLEQLSLQEKQVNEFLAFFKNDYDFDIIIYSDWSAKDVLGHITSWHESFAKNLLDVVHSRKPTPFKGTLTEVNEKGVLSMKSFSIDELIDKIQTSQQEISKNILNENVLSIPYKKGSRNYSRREHLEIVEKHIKGHLKDLNKKYIN